MSKIVALPKYAKQARKLLSSEERDGMEAAIAADPLAYPVIPGTSGFRKARWFRGASGKSGGVRAVFYFFVKGDTVFFALLFAKNQQENLSDDQKKQLQKLSEEIESATQRTDAVRAGPDCGSKTNSRARKRR